MITLRQNFDTVLYKSRIFLSGALLLAIGYFVLYTWIALPAMTLWLGWQPDTQLTVLRIIEGDYELQVTPGDVVLAIDGRPVQRGQPVFAPPVKATYQLTLQRGDQIVIQDIEVEDSQLFRMWKLSYSILAIAIWFVGFMMVQFARPESPAATHIGVGFQLIAAGIVSAGPSQLGAPMAWIVGHVLICYFPLIVLYLAFMPRNIPLGALERKGLRGIFYLSSALAVAAAVEVLVLFPERSWSDIVGISFATVLTALTGISIVAAVAVLALRLVRSPEKSYERQQLTILFVFLTLAVLPLFFFVILPARLTIFVPFPFVYSLFALAPAGYFFVLNRQGHVTLDVLFGRILTATFLVLAIGMAYATGTYLLNAVFHVNANGVGQGAFILLLLGVAITSQTQVQLWVDFLIYGRDLLDHDSVHDARAKLSANPEPSTVADVIEHVAAHLNVQHVAVLVRAGDRYRTLAGDIPVVLAPGPTICQDILLRVREPEKFIDLPDWIDLCIPITARGDMMGLFCLSRPIAGYFNARQIEILNAVADVLAFGLLVISLIETMQQLSQQALYEKELQRRRIATEIHNEPLHTLTSVLMQLHEADSPEMIRDVAQTIRQVTRDLRRIISGLRPPVLRESVEWITRQVVREFDEGHDSINVTLHPPEVHSSQQASEQTKFALYYVLTEALNNVSKHAQATEVEIRFCHNEEFLSLEVRDNGVGPKAATLPLTELLRAHHTGVADMYRWASVGEGVLEIRAGVPSGTVVELTLPTVLATKK